MIPQKNTVHLRQQECLLHYYLKSVGKSENVIHILYRPFLPPDGAWALEYTVEIE